jgi:putative two-component system response regulator
MGPPAVVDATLLDAIGAVVIVLAPDGRVVSFNAMAARLSGYTRDEVVGRSVLDVLMDEDDMPAVLELLDALEPERFPLHHETPWVDKDGDKHLISWTTNAMLDDEARISHLVSTGVEVSSERAAQYEAAQWRTRIDTFVDNAPAIIYWKGLDGRYALVNRRVEEITGRAREELLGRTPLEIFGETAARELDRSDREALGADRPLWFEHTLAHGDDERHYLTVKFALRGPDGSIEGVGGIASDMTDRVRAEVDLELSYRETLTRLARAVEFRDNDTGEHIQRMSAICAQIAKRLDIDPTRCALIRDAAPLHDAGKIAIPDAILLKPGRLTDAERAVMETHAAIGHDLLSGSSSPLLQLAATIAHTHHERYDGTGYPRGLTGEAIPLEGRIAAVADVYEALTSDRPYRAALPEHEAVKLMRAERGSHFDPAVLDAFLETLPAAHPDAMAQVDARRARLHCARAGPAALPAPPAHRQAATAAPPAPSAAPPPPP